MTCQCEYEEHFIQDCDGGDHMVTDCRNETSDDNVICKECIDICYNQ